MNIQNLLNQFTGSSNPNGPSGNSEQVTGSSLSNITSKIPGGLVGGAAAGGIMALLVGNKSARKFAGKAATYGGVAMLGGLAYKAFSNWQQNSAGSNTASSNHQPQAQENTFVSNETLSSDFQFTLIKAMIAATKADGHIDDEEQQRIFKAVDEMQLSTEMKCLVFDLLRQPIFIEELAHGARTMEQKTELYLASCLAINPDHPSEKAHLDKLAVALGLPEGLREQISHQAKQALIEHAA